MANNSTFSLENPQYYLEKYCHYDFRDSESYYTFEEMLWSSFAVLTSSLIVPCIRDQSSYFACIDGIVSIDSIQLFFENQVPYYTIVSQIVAAIVAIVGYYRRYQSAGFACFGLFSLALPFSVGILLPLTSFFVKKHKGKVPHQSYSTILRHTIFPYLAAAIGLPGIHIVLNSFIPCMNNVWSVCINGCCCCTIPQCKLPSDWKEYVESYASTLYAVIPTIWSGLAVFILIAPLVVFIGNTILILINAATLTVCIAVTTYISSMLIRMTGSSWKELIQRGVVDIVKELLHIKPREFDLAQVLREVILLYRICSPSCYQQNLQ
jgi:hypothetical protein